MIFILCESKFDQSKKLNMIKPTNTITIQSLVPNAKIVQGPFFKRRAISLEKGTKRTGITLEKAWKWENNRIRRIKKLRIALEENEQHWTGHLISWYKIDQSIPSILIIEKEICNGIHEIVIKDENNQRVLPQKTITIGRINYVPQNLEDLKTGAEIFATVITPFENLA